VYAHCPPPLVLCSQLVWHIHAITVYNSLLFFFDFLLFVICASLTHTHTHPLSFSLSAAGGRSMVSGGLVGNNSPQLARGAESHGACHRRQHRGGGRQRLLLYVPCAGDVLLCSSLLCCVLENE
jgi:hypothetical protein